MFGKEPLIGNCTSSEGFHDTLDNNVSADDIMEPEGTPKRFDSLRFLLREYILCVRIPYKPVI